MMLTLIETVRYQIDKANITLIIIDPIVASFDNDFFLISLLLAHILMVFN